MLNECRNPQYPSFKINKVFITRDLFFINFHKNLSMSMKMLLKLTTAKNQNLNFQFLKTAEQGFQHLYTEN